MSAEPASDLPGALLLCLDLQPSFLKALPDAPRLLARCSLAVVAAQGLGLPIAFTEQVPQKLGGTAPELLQLAPRATVIPKHAFSALGEPAVPKAIAAQGIEHLLICGLETPICVYQTAVDALNADLQVTILSDAVGARREPDAATCLRALARAGVHILPTETVFYALLGHAKHAFFRTYTELVKTYG